MAAAGRGVYEGFKGPRSSDGGFSGTGSAEFHRQIVASAEDPLFRMPRQPPADLGLLVKNCLEHKSSNPPRGSFAHAANQPVAAPGTFICNTSAELVRLSLVKWFLNSHAATERLSTCRPAPRAWANTGAAAKNGPVGAGSQFASLSAPGDAFWTFRVIPYRV
jgi:hypothetical protein